MAKIICNNWVQPLGSGNVKTNTQAQYIEDRVKPVAQICNPNRFSDVPRKNQPRPNVYNCMPCAKPCRSCDYHIGGKYFPPTPFSKQTAVIPSASSYTTDVKYYKSYLENSGWENPWPKTKSTFACMDDQIQILSDVATRMRQQALINCSAIRFFEREQNINNFNLDFDEFVSESNVAGFKKKYLL